jgi:ribosomal protein L9
MEVIRETIDTLGRAGQVVKVADGYACNYCFPETRLPATPEI